MTSEPMIDEKWTLLTMWTVYDHPSDFPDTYVARRCEVNANGGVQQTGHVLLGDLDVLRTWMVANGLTVLSRDPSDDPVIVEVWL